MASLFYQDEAVSIYFGDCREVITEHPMSLGPRAVHHVITDPPYDARTHAGARTMRREADQADGPHDLGIDFAPFDLAETFPRLLTLPSRWWIGFCALEMLGDYQRHAAERWIRGGFWHRPDGAPQLSGDRPGQPGEGIAICHRPGRKRWNGGGKHAFYEVGVERQNRVHPTQKPEALMAALVADFTDPGDVILDPFMGSGTTLVAAKRLGRKAIGIELRRDYCEAAVRRLQQGALALDFAEAVATAKPRTMFDAPEASA